MSVVLLVVAIVAVDLLVLWAVLKIVFRRGRRKVAERLAGLSAMSRADANFFGVTSRGRAQNRGNGVLAITDTGLLFVPMVGKNDLAVPLAAITRVDTAKSHLGKTVGRPLLRVAWRTGADEDSAAWLVGDTSVWVDQVAGAARRAGARLN